MKKTTAPVITIDGPSGSGKGTVGLVLARELGYHFLDSGALYRLLALAAMRHGVALENVADLVVLAAHMDVSFSADAESGTPRVKLEGEDVTGQIRTEEVGAAASQVAALPAVRDSLLHRQRAFATAPGLVADGRDMGTVVFPGAEVKIYLTASAEERARRRHQQLLEKGDDVSLAALVEKVRIRDDRDMNRPVAPLKPATDAIIIDSSRMGIDEVVQAVRKVVASRLTVSRQHD